jgi:hypothetical protein
LHESTSREHNPGITRISPKYWPSITQILQGGLGREAADVADAGNRNEGGQSAALATFTERTTRLQISTPAPALADLPHWSICSRALARGTPRALAIARFSDLDGPASLTTPQPHHPGETPTATVSARAPSPRPCRLNINRLALPIKLTCPRKCSAAERGVALQLGSLGRAQCIRIRLFTRLSVASGVANCALEIELGGE